MRAFSTLLMGAPRLITTTAERFLWDDERAGQTQAIEGAEVCRRTLAGHLRSSF